MITDQEIRSWFENHEAKYARPEVPEGFPTLEVLSWRNRNGGSDRRIDFCRQGGTLFVSGDLDEAVYQVYGEKTLKWFSEVDFDYFHRKCQASPKGRQYDDWCEAQARKGLAEHLCDVTDLDDLEADLSNEQDWLFWCSESADEFLGDYWEEWAPGIGRTPSLMCRSHHIGLRLAVQQLQERGEV